MAFSYSDENFTVIGNLCFVHIMIDGTKTTYDIPPAIADRILIGNNDYVYPCFPNLNTSGNANNVYALIQSNKIILDKAGNCYLICFFPIDSNK